MEEVNEEGEAKAEADGMAMASQEASTAPTDDSEAVAKPEEIKKVRKTGLPPRVFEPIDEQESEEEGDGDAPVRRS